MIIGKISNKMDYLFFCDADMRFVDMVEEEVLGTKVGTMMAHPAQLGTVLVDLPWTTHA